MKTPGFITSLFQRLNVPTFQPSNAERFGISPNLSTDDHWQTISGFKHDRSWAEIQEQYTDALTAWRKNPMAWRIISTTVNYVVGNGIELSSPLADMDAFIKAFWLHRKNHMEWRLHSMCEELTRSGDLFVVLFRNAIDGMSFIRFVTKDQILRIQTASNDWETELAYFEAPPAGEFEPRRWLSPEHPEASLADGIMLHYAVNKPMGALMGESDLTTIIPWLLRYSRMLEDRVRLHWAARAFLYLVTVPSNKVDSKSQQYASPPESGSIVVKDETENWETITPSLRGADASHDMKAVRNLIDAGSGFPPHWRGEGGDVNVATAEAMQGPPEKFLVKRQQYFLWMLQDILYQAYRRAVEVGAQPPIEEANYSEIFTLKSPDVSLRDNNMLAEASNKFSASMATLQNVLLGKSPTLHRKAVELVMKFGGEILTDEDLDRIISEAKADPIEPVFMPGQQPGNQP
ncbi:MAG: hypothetical protein ACM3H7_02345 [Acidobacteriaceae bacterium]